MQSSMSQSWRPPSLGYISSDSDVAVAVVVAGVVAVAVVVAVVFAVLLD